MGGRRSYQQCKQRWNVTLNQGHGHELNTSPWTNEEVGRYPPVDMSGCVPFFVRGILNYTELC